MADQRKVSLSGIQPTGAFTLGNYLGALRNWVALQDEFDCYYCVVDLHALTVRHEPKELRANILQAYAMLMACGVDPEKSTLFIQSHVPAHAELAWIMSCHTPYGELGRMTQFKDKSATHADNINAGLFSYPTLMASDILLYQPDIVPVGIDQTQHVELTRNIAVRMNGLFPNLFKIPQGYIPKNDCGGKVMSLQEPGKKMSKSDQNPKACIQLLDPPDSIIKKFKSAVTDSETEVVMREGKDGINNLITIYSIVTGKEVAGVEAEFAGRGYGDFKLAVGEAVADHLRPLQEEYTRLIRDRAFLEQCYRAGAAKAARAAQRTLDKVYKKLGLLPR